MIAPLSYNTFGVYFDDNERDISAKFSLTDDSIPLMKRLIPLLMFVEADQFIDEDIPFGYKEEYDSIFSALLYSYDRKHGLAV